MGRLDIFDTLRGLLEFADLPGAESTREPGATSRSLQRLKALPEDRICPGCERVFKRSRQWVVSKTPVEHKRTGAILTVMCRGCYVSSTVFVDKRTKSLYNPYKRQKRAVKEKIAYHAKRAARCAALGWECPSCKRTVRNPRLWSLPKGGPEQCLRCARRYGGRS